MFLLLLFQFTEIMFVDHQTGNKTYFKRQVNQFITAADNYGNGASTYGKWNSVGANNSYHYQLLICDTSFYAGFFVSGHTSNCFKTCDSWCDEDTRLTSVRRQPVHTTWAWLSTRMVIVSLATDSLALVFDKSHFHS